MNAAVATTFVLGLSAGVSGWFVLHSSGSRWSGLLLIASGALIVAGGGAAVLGLDGTAPVLFRTAGCLVMPLALVVYPCVSGRDPLSFVLCVVAGASGAISIVWADAVDSLGFVIVCALLVHTWWAYERSGGVDRRALTWSSLAWIVAGLASAFTEFLFESAGSVDHTVVDAVIICLLATGPPAMVVGVVRPELMDVRGLVTRTVVSATVFVCYVSGVVGLSAVGEAVRGQALTAAPLVVLCGLLAFGVRPMQVMLRGVVDRLLFGDRPDPLTAATSLADRIGDDPALALDAIRDALVLPYACLRAGEELLASSGSEVTHTRVLPLRLGDDAVGEIVVGLRAGDLGLSSDDEDVLRIVAPLLAQTLRARAMSRDLQVSREAVVTAVEEERRRLRRDLHDGLGPTLSGVAFATDAARNQLRSNPDRADELLVLLRADTAGAIKEIRRLVDGLRPPALDELGLVGAIRQHATSLHSATGSALAVTVDAQSSMDRLPAATEVAAYRIVVEALTNVARHAAASTATVTMGIEDGSLKLAVGDDGASREPWRPGVGITSMRERSQLVGGTLTVAVGDHGGLVMASIPLP